MKIPVVISVVATFLLFSLQDGQVAAQYPGFYGSPLYYGGGNSNDEDIGFLLALLLLAGRRGNCCNSCNSCNGPRTIPVPYPIPIPTNNPIIFQDRYEESGGESNRPEEIINITTNEKTETIISDSDKPGSKKPGAKSSSKSISNVNNGVPSSQSKSKAQAK